MVRMRKLAAFVVVSVALCASACSDPGERVTAEPTSAAPTPSDAPADINQLVKAGDTFAVVNPLWWITPTLPPVLATTDREQWVALPDLPEPVAAVGLAAAGDRLIVTALACEAPNGGRDLCAQEPEAIEGASGTMLAWVVAPDLSSYEPIDLPDGLTMKSDTMFSAARGSVALVATSDGLLLIRPDGDTELLGEAGAQLAGDCGMELSGTRLAAVDATATAEGPRDFQTISWIDINALAADPTVIDLPDDLPDACPFLTESTALWVTATEEIAIDLDTGALTRSPLPAEVLGIASVVNPAGGRDGEVDTDRSIFLAPDPFYVTAPFDGGIARRDPDGTWSVVSDQRITAEPTVFADNGLYVIERSPSGVRIDQVVAGRT